MTDKAILYLCKQEFPLQRNNEGHESFNKGNYRELLNQFADVVSVFSTKLQAKEE